MEKLSSMENELDDLAWKHQFQVIKHQDITGTRYTLLKKEDAWFYLLNLMEPDQTAH